MASFPISSRKPQETLPQGDALDSLVRQGRLGRETHGSWGSSTLSTACLHHGLGIWANPICKWEYSLEGEVPGLSTLHLLTNLGSPGEAMGRCPWDIQPGGRGIPPQFSSVQSLSRVLLFATPWAATRQASLSIANSRSPPKPMSIESMMHPTISSSVVLFSCPQSFPASGSFQMSQLFVSGGQSIGVSSSSSVLPMNIQDWSPLELTGWISLLFKGLSRVFFNITDQKHQFFSSQFSL